ncbi:hypothetical protein [Mariniflexile sp. AS56]|uniref:hypothetical protein n=1 Tax=Mariniflexile sp. AS56 TaxID=3063957 RepID=UPI0026E98C82|nr:hypothetical protein [Mariniflexile sp. AS56]MDO7171927.1 hypothetical protein [Mariniflexile sp. AS56]
MIDKVIINRSIKICIASLLIIAVSIGVISCDLERADNNSYLNEKNIKSQESIKTNIEEAAVLSDIDILNDSVLQLNALYVETTKFDSMYVIANRLEKDVLIIRGYLHSLAEKKLILLPGPSRFEERNSEKVTVANKQDSSNMYLARMEKLLENEIMHLKYLSSITNDIDFKVVTVKILNKLNYNLDQIQQELKGIINN